VDKLQIPVFITRFYPDLEVEKLWRHGLVGKLAKLKESIVFQMSAHLFIIPMLRQWRKKQLELPPRPREADQGELMDKGIPFFEAYSPTVFSKRPYWPDWVHVTGYWFLEHPVDWQPSEELRNFLAAGPPPVYIGFSSVINYDMAKMTNLSLDALALTGQRGILAAGWSNLGQKPSLPESVLAIEGAPHDWLFPQVAAAVHHGGAGTTGVALRTATPNIIVPFTYDNPFWAWRIAELCAGPPGIPPKDLTAERLADAIHTVLHDEAMRQRRQEISQAIQAEDGVARAVELFHQYTQ
jgi:UDP:flavonoid glycosyltransferase YjiC (YdhE family)